MDLISQAKVTPLALPIWRCHRAGYPADSAGGSLRISGRFHKATDTSPAHETWPALYSACSAAIALGEVVRNIQDDFSNRLVDLHMSKMDARFSRVLIAHDQTHHQPQYMPGLNFDQVCRTFDYQITQEFARMSREIAEAILVPSCTRFPEGNLVIFTDRLDASSTITVVDTIDLSLVKWRVPDPPLD
jgi:RES domain-containing protein